MHRLPAVVAAILRLGAYQMRYLDRIPVSAAVNESVKLAKGVKGRDWRGVVNGILRNLNRVEIEWPDRAHDPVNGLSITYSCPNWLTRRWIDRWGLEVAEAMCRHTVTIPPLTLRTNTLRCSREQLETRLCEKGVYGFPDVRQPPGTHSGEMRVVTGLARVTGGLVLRRG